MPGALMSKEDFGIIFGVGTAVYAFSFLVNGPLVDRIGGKRGILIAAVALVGGQHRDGHHHVAGCDESVEDEPVVAYSITYAANMYFQSTARFRSSR